MTLSPAVTEPPPVSWPPSVGLAMSVRVKLAAAVETYDAFTDIEFNPEKSLNCQAAAAALYRSLVHAGRLDEALSSQEAFLRIHPA